MGDFYQPAKSEYPLSDRPSEICLVPNPPIKTEISCRLNTSSHEQIRTLAHLLLRLRSAWQRLFARGSKRWKLYDTVRDHMLRHPLCSDAVQLLWLASCEVSTHLSKLVGRTENQKFDGVAPIKTKIGTLSYFRQVGQFQPSGRNEDLSSSANLFAQLVELLICPWLNALEAVVRRQGPYPSQMNILASICSCLASIVYNGWSYNRGFRRVMA